MIVFVLVATSLLHAGETALDRYVAKPDAMYSWKVVRTAPCPVLTVRHPEHEFVVNDANTHAGGLS